MEFNVGLQPSRLTRVDNEKEVLMLSKDEIQKKVASVPYWGQTRMALS